MGLTKADKDFIAEQITEALAALELAFSKRLDDKLEGFVSQLASVREVNAELKEELSELRNEKDELRDENEDLRRQLKELSQIAWKASTEAEEAIAKADDAMKEAGDAMKEAKMARNEVDDLQQYGRRSSVRIEGIVFDQGETPAQLRQKVKDNVAELGITMEDVDIFRLHRSSRPKRCDRRKDGTMIAQTLVKLRSWDIREALHYANKTAREKKVKIRVHHDLTKRRYGLLSRA